ncbi:MAG: fumarylacetoacetate hydrolase family protein [Rubrivivax sp.]
MTTALPLDGIAQEVLGAQDQRRQIAPLSGRHAGFDLPAAYTVARRVCDSRRAAGWRSVGRKIGFTNASIWDTYAVHAPIWGYMYEHTVVQLAAQDCRFDPAALVQPKIEPEIVLALHRAPEPGADAAALLRCIAWVAHGFELVQSHYPGWKFQAADTVADGGLHGALLVGARLAPEALGDDALALLQSFSLTLHRNGQAVDSGRGANVLGSPLAALQHLLQVLAAQPGAEPLHAGEIITTGTITAAFDVQPGDTWHTQLQGLPLPGLRVHFDA